MRHKLRNSIVAATLLSALGSQTHAADVLLPGFLKFEAWAQAADGTPFELAGANLDDFSVLPLIPSFGPPEVLYMNSFNTRSVYPDDSHENYLARITGTLTVPETADYHVYLRCDDDGRFYINLTGETPPDITSGVEVPLVKEDIDCCDAFIAPDTLDTDGDGFVDSDFNFDGFPDNDAEATTTKPIRLEAGVHYGITTLLKEGGGGDWLEVDVRKAGDTRPNAPLAGSFLSAAAPGVAITTQPASLSTSENFPVTLSVVANTSAGVTFQWQVGGVDIPGATNPSYTFTPVLADSGKVYRVLVRQATAPVTTVTSSDATLTVTADATPPTIASVGTFLDRTGVIVNFSEPMGSGLGTAANYAISGGVTITSAVALSDFAVFLRTSSLAASANHTLTVSNVRDQGSGGGNLVSPNTSDFTVSGPAPAGTALSAAGYQRFEFTSTWDDLMTKLSDGTVAEVDGLLANMEAPVDIADGYGARLRTYFIPPKTGNYVFYGHSDDRGAFYLSTDSDPANKKLIATEPVWNGNRAWMNLDRRDAVAPENRSDTFAGSEWPGGGDSVALVGGEKYYVEVIFLEGTGGDNGGLNFSIVDDADFPPPATGEPTRMVGTNIVWYGDAANFVFNFSMPASKVYQRGDTVTLEAIVTGPGVNTYQWYKNKMPVDGATSKTLTYTDAGVEAMGDYQLEVTDEFGVATRRPVEEGDDNVRLYMDGITMLIEAEDYNYTNGLHIASASLPSYRGDAYKGLKSTLDVDFFHDPDNSGGAAFAYTRMLATDPGVIEDKGGGDAVNNALGRNRGGFSVTANYALGWTEPNEWQNYTRTFQKGKYVVVGGVSHDGVAEGEINMVLSQVANPTVPDGSSFDTTTTDVIEGGAQGLTKLGSFLGSGTGAWSSNDMIPLTDDAGTIVQLDLDGLTTVRLTFNAVDGDADWFAFYCLDCTGGPVGPTIAITRTAGVNAITFSGSLQSSATVDGTYTDVAGASNPYTPPAGQASQFYRARQ